MVKFQAILFDLDGTLLDSNMENFLPHYFSRLAVWVAHIAPPRCLSLICLQRPNSCWQTTAV